MLRNSLTPTDIAKIDIETERKKIYKNNKNKVINMNDKKDKLNIDSGIFKQIYLKNVKLERVIITSQETVERFYN